MKQTIFIISGKNPLTAKSGYASYAHSLAKILSSLDYQVKIFCLGEKDMVTQNPIWTVYIKGSLLFKLPILKDIEMAGLPILSFQLASHLYSHLQSNNIVWGIGPWSFVGALVKIFKKDVILFSDYFTSIQHEYSGTISATNISDYGVLIKLKTIITSFTIIKLYTLIEKFIFLTSDKIIIHYKSTLNILSNQFHIKKSKFISLPYYIHLSDHTNEKPLSISKPLIISICRHDGRKGINFLLHAFSLLSSKELKYSAVIIGEGKLRKKHIELARKLRLSNVHQPGFVVNIKPYLNSSKLFVLPSLEEGSSSLAILEAMKVGLPIIATNIDGIPEDLTDKKSALLVPAKNPGALADAMQKLLENPKLAKKLGKAAKRSFQNKHNLKTIKKHLSLLITSYTTQ